ncbi:hypothetical protein ABMA27_002236 [Loxostege sticticalis]|uniref:DUF7041 domain-containing protein n=1 Tax=Loxostege sticticalis TaxID=481309 RepID=A0ABR3HX39_LOXSC
MSNANDDVTGAAAAENTEPPFYNAEQSPDVKFDLAGISIQSKILPFWREHPRLWFAQYEALINPMKISDEQKFRYVLGVLQTPEIQQISDILLKPPETRKYDALKERLLSVYQESETKQFQKLISGLELGDQKPTQLLRRMRELGGSLVPDDALKVMWMNQLPTYVRTVLSINKEATLSTLAAMADQMMEQHEPVTIASISNTTSTRPAETTVAGASPSPFDLLSKQIENLSLEIAELRRGRTTYRRPFRTHARSRSRSKPNREKTKKPGDSDWECRYHYRFGDKARKCESPCSRKKNNQGN